MKNLVIQEKWKEHKLFKQGHVELVPTDWLMQYWVSDTSQTADLKDGERVDLQGLWNDIAKNGLKDPLIMRVGLSSQTCRLEAGNHRIQVLKQHGIDEVPVTVQIREACGPDAPDPMNNGTHNFSTEGILRIQDTREKYMKPSEVFNNVT